MASLIMSSLTSHWRQTFDFVKKCHWMNERAPPNRPYTPTTVEHIANVITHGLWIPPSIWGAVSLVQRSTNWQQFWSGIIYSGSLILLFTISTIFHCVFFCHGHGPVKDVLHRSDRAMIYIFIAASYFPWLTLTPLPAGGWAAELWWLIWILASFGILYQQAFHERYKWLETTFYLFMGVAPALAIVSTDIPGLYELQLGGVCYLAGVIFFKMDGRIPFAHAIWHLFVAFAASVHYFAILDNLYPYKTQTSNITTNKHDDL
ncbi:monocyte to macrophage differentiation factor 2-like [Cloeon dipterum]|uniref:monocyte to macrophage differentiation factor 2-like n=1 Tax=Cloeon dipterum TaxID=197152 RepID=UPI00321FC10C